MLEHDYYPDDEFCEDDSGETQLQAMQAQMQALRVQAARVLDGVPAEEIPAEDIVAEEQFHAPSRLATVAARPISAPVVRPHSRGVPRRERPQYGSGSARGPPPGR